MTVCTLFGEIGKDLSRFPNASAFASWLKLCPNPRISGGRALGHSNTPSKPKLSVLFRTITQSLERSQTYLGAFYRRVKAKDGPQSAVKATAHKIARIIFAMLKTKQPYDEKHFEAAQKKINQSRVRWITQQAASLGLTVQNS